MDCCSIKHTGVEICIIGRVYIGDSHVVNDHSRGRDCDRQKKKKCGGVPCVM